MIGVRYVSLHEPSGYGESGRWYMLAMARAGVPITWTPMVRGRGWGLGYEPFSGRSVGDPALDELCNREIPYDVVVLHLVPEYYPRWSAIERGRKIAGYTVWETERLPARWPALLTAVDLVIVPCEWNREVFGASGLEAPVEVVPKCLDPDFAPCGPSDGDGEFTFYSINVWSDRKAIDRMLAAYGRAFGEGDRVRLALKTSDRHMSIRVPYTAWYPIRTRWLLGRGGPPVQLIGGFLSREGIADLHRRGDCYVSLTRAEGWGMGAFEAAASGRAVIMTGHGGQRDFLPPELAWLVDYRLEPTRRRWMDSHGGGDHWAAPDVDHAAALMRRAYEDRAETRRRGEELSRHVRRKFSAEAVARRYIEALERL